MEGLQQPTNANANANPNPVTNKEIPSVSNSVSVSLSLSLSRKRKGKEMRKREKRPTGNKNTNDSNDSDFDFDDTGDQVNIGRAESESESETEHGSNLNENVERSGYNLRSKNPPVPAVNVEGEDEDEDDINTNTNTNQSRSRLQQPPIYINPNLMKIKMESDYVPIVAVKQELAQDFNLQCANEEEDEQEQFEQNSSSLSVQPSSSSSPGSDVNGIHGESEIRMMDMEAKLQSALNSFEHVNENENGSGVELNPQELQYLIRCIRTSRVETQDSEPQHLDSKLKFRDENPESAETLNPNPNPVKNPVPDLPTKVLSHVFDHLDIKSLKKSRLVCRLWREEAGKILLQNFYLVCDNKTTTTKCEKSLQNWISIYESESGSDSDFDSNSAAKSIVALKLCSKDKNAQTTLKLLNKLPRFRNSITELKYVQWDTKSLYEILQLLPNLKVLQTNTLDLSPGQKWLMPENDKSLNNGNGNEIPQKLQLLIKKLERIKKFKLDFCMGKEAARHFLRHQQEFSAVGNLEIHAAGMSFITELLCHLNSAWTITRFTLDLHENFDVGLIRSFIIRISQSLQHVKFIVGKGALQSSSVVNLNLNLNVEPWNLSSSGVNLNVEPWKDDWMIPIGLTGIQSVELVLRPQEISASLQKFMLKSIIISLTLPQLKKLAVDFIPVELQETVDNWNRNSYESAGGRKLKSESLEELEVVPHFPQFETSSLISQGHQGQTKIPGHPWPRLKSLKCSFKNPGSFDSSFLSELENLERLELKIWLDWSRERNNVECGNNPTQNPSKFQLRDLKNLKSFSLKFSACGQRSQDFGNDLVHSDLKFMKSLQSVQFHRVLIDAEPLKSALGPNVSIIFSK